MLLAGRTNASGKESIVEARDTAIAVTRLPTKPREPAPFVKARAEATKLVDALEPRIPSVQIAVEGPPVGTHVDITLDGVSVPSKSLELARKTNPGKHSIQATANGYTDATTEVTLAEGETVNVKLSLARLPEKPSLNPAQSTSVATFEPSAPAPSGVKDDDDPLRGLGL